MKTGTKVFLCLAATWLFLSACHAWRCYDTCVTRGDRVTAVRMVFGDEAAELVKQATQERE